MHSKTGRVLKKTLKVFAWTIGSIVVLLIAVAALIQIPAIQLKLTQEAVSFIEDKIGTEVALKGISIAFPKKIVLEGIYLEDQKGDTLLYAGKLAIDTDLWGLAQNEIQLNHIRLENTVAKVDRPPEDSAFNFTYILEAFAGDSTKVSDTLEQEGWGFSLEALQLENIRLRFQDSLAGNHANVSLGEFALEMDEFDLKNNRYAIGEILLSGTRADFSQSKIPRVTEELAEKNDSAAALIISLSKLAFQNVQLDYAQIPLGQRIAADIGELEVNPETIDLEAQNISLNEFSLHNSLLSYKQRKADTIPEAEPVAKASPEEPGWTFSLERLDLTNNRLAYENHQQPRIEDAFDFNHVLVTDLNLDVRDMKYGPETIQADLRELSFREQSGFEIKRFTTDINLSGTEASINHLIVETNSSRLQLQATAEYPSLKDIGESWQQATVAAEINASDLSVRDLLYFHPSALDSLPLDLTANSSVRLDAVISGAVDNLTIGHLNFQTLSETSLKASGKIAGLPQTNALRMDLAIDKFYTTRADLEQIVSDSLLPDSLNLPPWINMEAKYQGSLDKADFSTVVTTGSGGEIDLRGNMNLDSASALRGISATLDVRDFNVGNLLGKPDSLLGSVSLRADIHTNGLSPEEMNGTLEAIVGRFDFQGYRYHDLVLHGDLRNQLLTAEATMNDNNLNFKLDAGYNFQNEVPRYKLSLDIRNADLQALNFSQSPIRARGILMVDMETADFKVLNGDVGVRKVAVFNGDELYTIDSLLFASIDQKGRAEINIDSDVMNAKFEGSINIFALPAVLQEYFGSYYSLNDSPASVPEPGQHFSFQIDLKNTDLLTGLLVPQLTSFVPGEITGEFDSEARKLDLRMDIDELHYANVGIDSFVFSTHSNREKLNYNIHVDRIMVDSMRIDGLQFNGTVANDSIETDLIILDSADRHKYVLAGLFFSRGQGFEFRFSPDDIVLNYQQWSVPPDNLMRFGGEKFVAESVVLTNRREKIIIASEPEPGTPVTIGFRELNLEYLSSMIAQERLLSGLLEGDIHLYPDSAAMTFTSDLSITDFRIQDVPWGDASLRVDRSQNNIFEVDFGLNGHGNAMAVRGSYQAGDSPAIELAADIERFGLGSLQPLVAAQIRDLKGELSGRIMVKGAPDRPDIDGGIAVRNTGFFSSYLNTSFTIDDESITFVEEGISFNAFEIGDGQQNTARVNGTLLTSDYRDFRFNLDLRADRFRLIDTEAGDNELFYGRVDLEANARIRGDMTTPVITMDVGLSDGSNLTYVVPQSEAAVLESEGIVKFVDKTFEGDPFMRRTEQEASDTIKSEFRGIDLTARIELSEQENFTIIIDPVTGDQLSVRGNTTLTLKIDPSGDIQLAGRYEISEGTYNLSFYKFVKREFTIENGSSIVWTGEPLNAQMDIRAIYEVETAPIELFSNQLTGADPSEVNRYRQRLPFQVYLNITGELLQPEIAFELEMPMEERNVFGGSVYARLQDINTRESDLNKQVFALLILKRFISDDPFENKAGGGFESTARRSVSKVLSEQLNRLSENIKGVELSFDIKSYEDYSTGQAQGRTELQLGFSKSLLNDRLVVKLSGNVDLEGQDANREATDYIGDLALEYKLTPDGRFRITGFRNSNYDMIDGELTETGAGLIYVKDYNSLSELFKANAETRN